MCKLFIKCIKKLMAAMAVCLLVILCSCTGHVTKNANSASSGTTGASDNTVSTNDSSASSTNTSSVGTAKPEAKKHIICIDPGHQSLVDTSTEPIAPGSAVKKMKNPGGTEGIVSKTPEYVINLSVSKKIQALLTGEGYKVVMTRESDDANISNIDRARIANTAEADIFLRIHADGVDDESVHGASVLIPKAGYIKDAGLITKSRTIGGYILNGIVASTGAASRGLSPRDDMTGFNWSRVPVVLVEMGFLSNPHEDSLMNTDAYQNKIAAGIVNGIDAYFSYEDKPK